MKGLVCWGRFAAVVLPVLVGTAHAEVASIYGVAMVFVATRPQAEND